VGEVYRCGYTGSKIKVSKSDDVWHGSMFDRKPTLVTSRVQHGMSGTVVGE
jgi:hypothetical protein